MEIYYSFIFLYVLRISMKTQAIMQSNRLINHKKNLSISDNLSCVCMCIVCPLLLAIRVYYRRLRRHTTADTLLLPLPPPQSSSSLSLSTSFLLLVWSRPASSRHRARVLCTCTTIIIIIMYIVYGCRCMHLHKYTHSQSIGMCVFLLGSFLLSFTRMYLNVSIFDHIHTYTHVKNSRIRWICMLKLRNRLIAFSSKNLNNLSSKIKLYDMMERSKLW